MSKPRWIALALIGLAVVSVAASQAPRVQRALERWLERRTRVALLAELQPVVLKNCTLKRFGSANDGGYLLCDNLSEGIQSAYSYGVGANDELMRRLQTVRRAGASVRLFRPRTADV